MEQRNQILEEDAEHVLKEVDISYIHNKIIMITGASGLIGTHIIYSIKKYVEQTSAKVQLILIIFHDLPNHLKFVEMCPWITVIQGDLTDSLFLAKLPNADIIFHCAGYASPKIFMENWENTLKINTITTFGLLDKLRYPNATGKFIFMSSSSVYTGCTTVPFVEEVIGNTNTTHARACYIEGKKCGEAICNAYRFQGVDAKSVRLSITYGPGVKSGDVRALNSFIESAIKKKKIQLLDDGKAKKSYLYISDAVELIWKMLLYGKEAIYNLGGKEKISIIEVANKVGKKLNVPVYLGISEQSSVEGSLLLEELSMTKTVYEFGKRQYVEVEKGLNRTIDWAILNFSEC